MSSNPFGGDDELATPTPTQGPMGAGEKGGYFSSASGRGEGQRPAQPPLMMEEKLGELRFVDDDGYYGNGGEFLSGGAGSAGGSRKPSGEQLHDSFGTAL